MGTSIWESLEMKHEIAQRISEQERSESIALISEENPNPVLRVTIQGHVLYANGPAKLLLEFWNIDVGDQLPDDWRRAVVEAEKKKTSTERELLCHDSFFALTLQPVVDADYVNLYGRVITRRKET